jgi:alkylation response protein AidB-like acyl-CoA dehydrogenase
MTADLADVRDELRAVARDLLRRRDRADTQAIDWRLLADAGWLGLEVPVVHDGAGATFAKVVVIVEEMGRAAAPGPYLGAVVLGVGTLTLLEPSSGRDKLLQAAASGDVVPAAALSDGALDSADSCPPFRLVQSPTGLRVHGTAAFVPDAADADWLLLLALDPGGAPVAVPVEPGTEGLGVMAQPVLDQTRRMALVTADGVPIDDRAVWRFAGDPASAVRRLLDRAAVAVACDSLGVSEAMLDATVAYARVREQFGRPIGSFQAVKHACADMLVQISVARGLVSAAVENLAEGAGSEDAAAVAASMAKSYVCASAVAVAGSAMQVHGGIGYTWESGIHVYLKRAALNRSLFGSPAAHRKRLAARYQSE